MVRIIYVYTDAVNGGYDSRVTYHIFFESCFILDRKLERLKLESEKVIEKIVRTYICDRFIDAGNAN